MTPRLGLLLRLGLPWAAGLVDAVRQSATLLFEWRIAPTALAQAATPEATLLHASLAAMDARLGELSAAAPWSALQQLAEQPPQRIPTLVGFASHTPAQRALLSAWAQRGAAAPAHRGAVAATAARIRIWRTSFCGALSKGASLWWMKCAAQTGPARGSARTNPQ